MRTVRWEPLILSAFDALLACLLVVMTPAAAYAQARFLVELEVDAHEELVQETRSFLGRELRSIPDVAVVDSAGQWRLMVLADQIESRSGEQPMGIVLAATLVEVIDGDVLAAVDPTVSQALRDQLNELPFRDYKRMWVLYGGLDDMPILARRLIAGLDVSILEANR